MSSRAAGGRESGACFRLITAPALWEAGGINVRAMSSEDPPRPPPLPPSPASSQRNRGINVHGERPNTLISHKTQHQSTAHGGFTFASSRFSRFGRRRRARSGYGRESIERSRIKTPAASGKEERGGSSIQKEGNKTTVVWSVRHSRGRMSRFVQKAAHSWA